MAYLMLMLLKATKQVEMKDPMMKNSSITKSVNFEKKMALGISSMEKLYFPSPSEEKNLK